jgi:hypothetical protein
MALPDDLFAHLIEVNSIDQQVEQCQNRFWKTLKEWKLVHGLVQGPRELWYKGNALVVPDKPDLHCSLLQ